MTKSSRCRGCGNHILWGQTKRGAKMPLDPEEITIMTADGEVVRGWPVHWQTCPQAEKFKGQGEERP